MSNCYGIDGEAYLLMANNRCIPQKPSLFISKYKINLHVQVTLNELSGKIHLPISNAKLSACFRPIAGSPHSPQQSSFIGSGYARPLSYDIIEVVNPRHIV